MTDREKAIVMAYTGVAMLTGNKLDEYYKYCSELLGHPAYTHEVYSKDISERAKNDFIKLCKEEDEYRWHDLRKDPEDLPEAHKLVFAYRNFPFTEYLVVERIENHWFSRDDKEKDIIAWRYIEPFGGKDDAEIH